MIPAELSALRFSVLSQAMILKIPGCYFPNCEQSRKVQFAFLAGTLPQVAARTIEMLRKTWSHSFTQELQ